MQSKAAHILRVLLFAAAILLFIGYAGSNYFKMKRREAAEEVPIRTAGPATEQQYRAQMAGRLRGLARDAPLADVLKRAQMIVNDRRDIFFTAVDEGRADIVAGVLRIGYDPARSVEQYDASYVGPVNETEIQYHLGHACGSGYTDVVRVLVSAGADISHCNYLGLPPLAIAAERGHADVAAFLLQRGAKVDQPVRLSSIKRDQRAADEHHLHRLDGMTPLMLAAESRHPDVVKLLLEHGADVHHKAKDGADALTACRRGRPDKALIDTTMENGAITSERFRKIEAKVASRVSQSEVESLLTH